MPAKHNQALVPDDDEKMIERHDGYGSFSALVAVIHQMIQKMMIVDGLTWMARFHESSSSEIIITEFIENVVIKR